jgi:hypothetical protein
MVQFYAFVQYGLRMKQQKPHFDVKKREKPDEYCVIMDERGICQLKWNWVW